MLGRKGSSLPYAVFQFTSMFFGHVPETKGEASQFRISLGAHDKQVSRVKPCLTNPRFTNPHFYKSSKIQSISVHVLQYARPMRHTREWS